MIQIISVGIALFFLYRFLLKTIGVEQFGIWSLVLSTTSIIGAANLGISGSIVKFVAKYIAR
ncbi:MAG: polysaccharide biosynthesis C-terminal domain-containing protein, partial [Verrucomicrobiia bacterium]